MPKLSIVIATYNRAAELIRTLDSFVGQRLEPALWEIVTVNNNSTDDTEARFAAWQAVHPEINVRIVFEEQQGLSHARNRGVAESRGAYIVMVDDDVEVNDAFVAAYYNFFESHPDIAAAGGRILPLYEYAPPRWLTKYAEQPIAGTTDLGESVKPMRKTPIGCNMAFRRVAVEKYGGFDTILGRKGNVALAGEEKAFFRRMLAGGEKIFYIPEAVVHHIIPQSRLTGDYFDRVTFGAGVSERIRTLQHSPFTYLARLLGEGVRWGATLVLAIGYLLQGTPSKGRYLIRMRRNITRGLL